MKHFLNDFEIIAQTKNDTPTLSIRVLKIRELGECIDRSCPLEKLYIAVSEYGEYPDQNVFVSKKAEMWKFSGWESLPKEGEYPYKAVFNVKFKKGGEEYIQRVTLDTKTIEFSDGKEITSQ